MKQFYKIKVGIEEFSVEESDIPRIAEAMKHNDMVKLDCGLFRGSAILAVCRDEEREKQQLLIETTPQTTEEELEKIRIDGIKRDQRLNCEICGHTGWKEDFREESLVRVPCDCTLIKNLA